MLKANEIITELSDSGVTVHSSFLKDVQLPMINLDWGATNRPVSYVETKIQGDPRKMYGNPNSCGTLTGETARDLIDKASDLVYQNMKIDPQRYKLMFGGDGSTYWLEMLPRTLWYRYPQMEAVTLQKELHNSLLQPWLESGYPVHLNKDIGWLEKYIQFRSGTGRKLVLLVTLSSHLTGYSFSLEPLMELFKSLSEEDRPIVVADATCYLSHHSFVPPGLSYDFLCFSGHKFPGGPGSCGCLAVARPLEDLFQIRGTPNVMGISRLGLAVKVRNAVMMEGDVSPGDVDKLIEEMEDMFQTSERSHTRFVLHRWDQPNTRIQSEPVFSFSVKLTDLNKYIHPQIVSTILLNAFGLQIRAGGQCADYVVNREGPWSHLEGLDDDSSIMHPSICRISLPRYLLTKDLFHQIKNRLIDFLYVARFMIPAFYPRLDGWRLHPDYHKYVTLNKVRNIEFTGRSHYCGTCQEKRDKIMYSTDGKAKKDELKSGLEIYHLMEDGVLRHLKHDSVHPETTSLYDHPFRWFVHPSDHLEVDF